MANEKLGVATKPQQSLLKFHRGALHFCIGAWHSQIWTNITVLWCFIFQFEGTWSFVSEGISPTKPPPPYQRDCAAKLQLAFECNWLAKVLRGRDMSSLRDMSNFLFISMTGPKVAQRIQVVSILLHEAKAMLGIFCLHLNTIVWSGHVCCRHFCLQQLAAVQRAKPKTVIVVQQAKSWNKYWSKKNKTKRENIQQPQAQPHIRSSVDHEAEHTSGQSPVMRTATNHVTRPHMIITWPSSIMINEVFLVKTVWGIPEIRV